MSKLAARAEIDKLATTLALERPALEFLEDVPAEQLRALRIAVYERLFSQDRVLFRRLAAVASRLPARLVVALGERVLGPFVAARVAAEMSSRHAVAVAVAMSSAFRADVCRDLDPRRTRDMLRQLPIAVVVDMARQLVARGDFMTISRFVDFFDDEAIAAVQESIEDEGALLQIAFYVGSKNRLDHLFRIIPRARMETLIERVRTRPELIAPFLSLLIHVSYARKRELGDLAARQDDAALAAYVRVAHEQGLWPDMLSVVAAMSEPARRRVVNLPILREPAVQESVIRAADAHELWGLVLPLVAMMDDANREAVAGIVAAEPTETLQRASEAALMGERWDTLLDLVRRMPRPRQLEFTAIARGFGEVDPDLLERIARTAAGAGLDGLFAAVGATPAPPEQLSE